MDEVLAYVNQVALPAVRDQGWTVQGFTVDAAELGGNITYTAGLSEAGLPELAVTGLPHATASVILNEIAAVHLCDELRPGRQIGSASGVRLLVVDGPGIVGPLARVMYGAQVRFLQLLWADDKGRFPTSPAWRDNTHPRQPVYDAPLPITALPTGGGVVGHLDQVLRRNDVDRRGRGEG